MSATRRRLIGLVVGAAAWRAASASLLACPVCFNGDQGPVTRGVLAAVMVLVSVTAGVLLGFGRFAVRLARYAEPRTPEPRTSEPRTPEPSEPRTPAPRNLGTPEPS